MLPAVAQYREHGWVSVADMFPKAQMAALSQLTSDLAQAHLDMALEALEKSAAVIAEQKGGRTEGAARLLGRAIGGDAEARALVRAVGAGEAVSAVGAAAAAAETSSPSSSFPPSALPSELPALFAVDDFDARDDLLRGGDGGGSLGGAPSHQLGARKIGDPYAKHASYREVVHSARLHSLAESLIGKPAAVYATQVFVKTPGGVGAEKPFHQDNYYFRVRDSADVLTCWVALDDAAVDNGCMQMCSGSHRWARTRQTPRCTHRSMAYGCGWR
jgi:hypothetical protein